VDSETRCSSFYSKIPPPSLWSTVRIIAPSLWSTVRIIAPSLWSAIRIIALFLWSARKIIAPSLWSAIRIIALFLWSARRIIAPPFAIILIALQRECYRFVGIRTPNQKLEHRVRVTFYLVFLPQRGVEGGERWGNSLIPKISPTPAAIILIALQRECWKSGQFYGLLLAII
jgi:hypothetical protein